MKKKKFPIMSIVAFLLVLSFLARDSLSAMLQSIQQRFIAETDTVEVILEDKLQRTAPIVPESVIPLDMNARNLGTDCYVRFKVSVYSGDNFLRELPEEDMELADGWKKKADGYFYYQDKFEENELLDLYDAITLHHDVITKEGQILIVETTIQAIQSDQFEDTQDGWGDAIIQQTTHSRNEVILDA